MVGKADREVSVLNSPDASLLLSLYSYTFLIRILYVTIFTIPMYKCTLIVSKANITVVCCIWRWVWFMVYLIIETSRNQPKTMENFSKRCGKKCSRVDLAGLLKALTQTVSIFLGTPVLLSSSLLSCSSLSTADQPWVGLERVNVDGSHFLIIYTLFLVSQYFIFFHRKWLLFLNYHIQ